MKQKILLLIVCLILVFNSGSYPCTTFLIHTDNELVFGRNYDFVIGYGNVIVNKRNVNKIAFADAGDNPAKWVSKYGSLTFNQFGREFPTGGINEAGLVVELMWLDGTEYPKPDDRPAVSGVLGWIQYQLDNSATVQDVIDSDKLIRIPFGDVPLHYLVADKSGNCASIEFLNGKLVYHSAVQVLTNDSYESSIEYLKGHKGFGGEKDIKGGIESLDRFVKACSMLKEYNSTGGKNAIEYGFEILKNVSQGEHTKWSIVYDIKNMKAYFRTYDNAKLKNIDLSSLDYSCDTQVKMMDVNSDKEGNVNLTMTDYTLSANRQLIEDSFTHVSFLSNVTANERQALSEYPDKLVCVSK